MSESISDADLAAAREQYLAIKDTGTVEEQHAAAHAFAELRTAWRQQEVDAGRRNPGVAVSVEDGG